MKKIIGMLVLIATLGISFSRAAECATPCRDAANTAYTQCKKTADTTEKIAECDKKLSKAITDCGNECPAKEVMGIKCDPDLLVNGQCKLNIYDTLGIRKSVRDEGDPTSVGLFVQDVVLSATFFIGTLVTIALVVSGIMFIMASSSGKDPANAKNGIIGSLVGLLIVVSSYVIIRLVQYIAKGF